MDQKEYAFFASKFATLPYPVIITDLDLRAVYFNPVAAAHETFLMSPDFVTECLSPQARQILRRTRMTGKEAYYLQKIGKKSKMQFLICVKRENKYLKLSFFLRPDEEYKQRLKFIRDFAGGCDHVMRSSLHQLLTASDLMAHFPVSDPAALGGKCRSQVMQALRVTQQMSHLAQPIHCDIINFVTLLNLIIGKVRPFIKEKFGRDMHINISGNATVKCDARLTRGIILNMISTIVRYTENDISLQYAEGATDVELVVRNQFIPGKTEGAVKDSIPESVLGVSACSEYANRMQGDFYIHMPDQNNVILSLSLPRAFTDSALDESLEQLVQEDIDLLEIEFSDLL